MPAGQRPGGRDGKKLTLALRLLEEEAYGQFTAAREGYLPRKFSCRLFGSLAQRWSDWQRGIPPGRSWCGRGGQNPRLLDAFAALDQAQARADREAARKRAAQRS